MGLLFLGAFGSGLFGKRGRLLEADDEDEKGHQGKAVGPEREPPVDGAQKTAQKREHDAAGLLHGAAAPKVLGPLLLVVDQPQEHRRSQRRLSLIHI